MTSDIRMAYIWEDREPTIALLSDVFRATIFAHTAFRGRTADGALPDELQRAALLNQAEELIEKHVQFQ